MCIRDSSTGVDGRSAAGLVVGAGRNMSTHGADRIAKGGAVLDRQPFNGIGIITAPDLGIVAPVSYTHLKSGPAPIWMQWCPS